jgi:hypothetical protein
MRRSWTRFVRGNKAQESGAQSVGVDRAILTGSNHSMSVVANDCSNAIGDHVNLKWLVVWIRSTTTSLPHHEHGSLRYHYMYVHNQHYPANL